MNNTTQHNTTQHDTQTNAHFQTPNETKTIHQQYDIVKFIISLSISKFKIDNKTHIYGNWLV